MNQNPVITPCIKVCVMDEATGFCLGCGRKIEEIGGWSQMSDSQRIHIMEQLPDRIHALQADGKR